MGNTDMIIVFFGELSTKGKNIMNFIRLLANNIKVALKDFELPDLMMKKIRSNYTLYN